MGLAFEDYLSMEYAGPPRLLDCGRENHLEWLIGVLTAQSEALVKVMVGWRYWRGRPKKLYL